MTTLARISGMNNIEKIFIGLLLGSIFPILLFLTGWWTTYKNPLSPFFAFAGLSIGLIIDILLLKRWIRRAYSLPVWQLIGIYLFYSIGIYGFFMGFPVFNIFMGIVAGFYYGKRINYNKIPFPESKKLTQKVPLFTGFIMTFVCVSSASLALMEKTIGKELQHMLGLTFEVTHEMIWGIILIGGLSLILGQYFITKITITMTINEQNYL